VKTCCICHAAFQPAKSYGEACPTCECVWQTCCTSADEAVRHQVPKLSAAEVERCLTYERRHTHHRSVITALERRQRKLAKAAAVKPYVNGGAA